MSCVHIFCIWVGLDGALSVRGNIFEQMFTLYQTPPHSAHTTPSSPVREAISITAVLIRQLHDVKQSSLNAPVLIRV